MSRWEVTVRRTTGDRDSERPTPAPKQALRNAALYLAGREDRIWLFTLMKSGTTYTLNFLLNYCKLVSDGIDASPASGRVLEAFHTFEQKMKERDLPELFALQRALIWPALGYDALIHTHVEIPSPRFKRILCLTRNPLDFCVSSYYFHVRNRGRKETLAEALDERLDIFCACFAAQRKVVEQHGDVARWVHYEQLMADPARTFGELLRWLGIEPDSAVVAQALKNSTKDVLRDIEAQRGEPLIAGPEFSGESFIRSGRVGEWRELFDDALLQRAKDRLARDGITLGDFDVGAA